MREDWEAFQAWTKRFPAQYRVLKLFPQLDPSLDYDDVGAFGPQWQKSFESEHAELYVDRNRVLYIKSILPELIDDFEYLTGFAPIEMIQIGHRGTSPTTISIGRNLHLLPDLQTVLIFASVSSVADDFHLTTPRLGRFEVAGAFHLEKTVLQWPMLGTLVFGSQDTTSKTDFLWCQNIPHLYKLSLNNCDLTSFQIDKISTSVEHVVMLNCALNELTQRWRLLTILKLLYLLNCGLHEWAIDILASLPLTTIDFSNLPDVLTNRNDFSGTVVNITSAFHRLELLDLNDTNLLSLRISISDSQNSFALRKLDITNPNASLVVDDPHQRISALVSVSASGEYFPPMLFHQPLLEEYAGPFTLNHNSATTSIGGFDLDLSGERPTFPFSNTNIAEITLNYRDHIFERLVDANPELNFENFESRVVYNPPTPKPVEPFIAKPVQYFSLYDPKLATENPFDPESMCIICFEGFSLNTQQPESDLNNGFVFSKDPIQENLTVVTCNFTQRDYASHTQQHYNHFFHLSCYQGWLRIQKTCPINRDKFLR